MLVAHVDVIQFRWSKRQGSKGEKGGRPHGSRTSEGHMIGREMRERDNRMRQRRERSQEYFGGTPERTRYIYERGVADRGAQWREAGSGRRPNPGGATPPSRLR